jgi:cyclase
MLKKRLILVLTFNDGVLFRTKKFIADYRYTKNFIDLWSADEIILLDISKKNRLSQKFLEIVKFFSLNCFLPISVGGGIRSFKDAVNLFKQGADKIVLNSSTYKKPDLIKKISKVFGSQSIIHSIDCSKIKKNKYEVITNNAFKTNLDPIQWAKIAIQNGCGELLINSIDNDGSLLGYDLELVDLIVKKVKVPCLALGGAGNWDHIVQLFKKTNISAACTQNIYHFTNESLKSAKEYLKKNKVQIRQ